MSFHVNDDDAHRFAGCVARRMETYFKDDFVAQIATKYLRFQTRFLPYASRVNLRLLSPPVLSEESRFIIGSGSDRTASAVLQTTSDQSSFFSSTNTPTEATQADLDRLELERRRAEKSKKMPPPKPRAPRYFTRTLVSVTGRAQSVIVIHWEEKQAIRTGY